MAHHHPHSEKKIYIGDLPRDVRKDDIREICEKYGRLDDVWLARKPPGFAFAVYRDRRDAADAVRDLDGRKICGATVSVELSIDRYNRTRGNNLKCYRCKRLGHRAGECLKPRSGRDEKRRDRRVNSRRVGRSPSYVSRRSGSEFKRVSKYGRSPICRRRNRSPSYDARRRSLSRNSRSRSPVSRKYDRSPSRISRRGRSTVSRKYDRSSSRIARRDRSPRSDRYASHRNRSVSRSVNYHGDRKYRSSSRRRSSRKRSRSSSYSSSSSESSRSPSPKVPKKRKTSRSRSASSGHGSLNRREHRTKSSQRSSGRGSRSRSRSTVNDVHHKESVNPFRR